MKHKMNWIRVLLVVLCLITLFSLGSCKADMKVENHTELVEQFLNAVVKDDYDAAFALVEEAVSDADFREYWTVLHESAEGATAYESEQVGWNINVKNGVKMSATTWEVRLDNEKTIMLQLVTCDDIEGIAGVQFTDVTEFMRYADKVVLPVNIVLLVVSLLAIAFGGWMFVDCLRRKIKYKVLWLLLILFGVAFTVTVGAQSGFHFSLGLMISLSSITADPTIASLLVKLVVPVGAIVYFFMRKRLTVVPSAPVDGASAAEASAIDGMPMPEEEAAVDRMRDSDETDQ